MTEPSGVDDGSVAFSDWFSVLDEDFPTKIHEIKVIMVIYH